MSRTLHLVDPPPTPAWAPFASCRPVAELRAGVRCLREWWEAFVDAPVSALHVAPHLVPFPEIATLPVTAPLPVAGPAVVGSADFLPFGTLPEDAPAGATLMHGDRAVGWVVPAGTEWDPDARPAVGPPQPVEGMLLQGAFDLVTALERLLAIELEARMAPDRGDEVPPATTVLGDPGQLAIYGATVEPGVVFDVRTGPIVLEAGAIVRSDTRLEGPVWIGPRARIAGGPIKHVAIGPRCTARGEMAATIMMGYANKAHDGFVGHSVIGHWANLGAGTITSNLKNTYGAIALEVDGVKLVTGRQFLGSLVGDHAKTAIGTLLGTGTVVGTGANVFGAMRPPRSVPPFAWGADGTGRMRRDGFLTIAARVLPRRDVAVDDAMRAFLGRLYDAHVSA
jgi:UDP-N-acetylglucosamine diphosphorylase/glucosamine-1-phosphate N-acetyltransferase